MTYEPALADGTLAGERKGSGNYHLIVTGKAAHAGRAFHEGANAVAGAAILAARLHAPERPAGRASPSMSPRSAAAAP
jgi:glutamate carboxypeptidase